MPDTGPLKAMAKQNSKHQSTKAPKHQSTKAVRAPLEGLTKKRPVIRPMDSEAVVTEPGAAQLAVGYVTDRGYPAGV